MRHLNLVTRQSPAKHRVAVLARDRRNLGGGVALSVRRGRKNPLTGGGRRCVFFSMKDNEIEQALARYSTQLSPEAGYYWDRHLPRFRYVMKAIEDLSIQGSTTRVLDVGMGFQTMWLGRLFSGSVVDCLGCYFDERFKPDNFGQYHQYDFNGLVGGERFAGAPYDLVVFMEVLEHLYVSPDLVLGFLRSMLRPGGILVLSTPNAVWIKNRIKMIMGKNPYELLRSDGSGMGHIREYTKAELSSYLEKAGFKVRRFERRGLYHFNNPKDNFYSFLADRLHSSLSRTLFVVCELE